MWKFAVRNLLSRPMRSLLSLLGLSVAIAGMVGLFSVSEGLDQLVTSAFGRIPGLVAMQPGAPVPLFSRIPADWEREIAAVDGVAVVNPEILQRANLIESKLIVSPPRFLFGTKIESRLRLKHGIYRDEIIAGRFLTLDDRGTLNAVVSKQIAEEFHKGVGDTLRVGSDDFRIVGIYHCGSILLDVAIILDIDQVRRISRFDADSVSCFYIEQQEGTDAEELAERIRSVFRGRKVEHWQPPPGMGILGTGSGNPVDEFFTWLDRSLKSIPQSNLEPRPAGVEPADPTPPGQQAANTNPRPTGRSTPPTPENADVDVDESLPVEVRSAVDWAARFDKFTRDLDLVLTIITGIGVTIAVLSIINTMLMSVTERIIEFGILKANGWSKTDVMRLITYESAVLGLGGGLLGSLAGWTATHAINAIWPTQANLYASPQLLLFSVLFSSLMGVLGGLYPAIWAMRMMPMDAIRRG